MSATTDRIVDISDGGFRLREEHRQLVIQEKDGESWTIPFEEIAVVVVSSSWATYSHAVLVALAEAKGVLITCDRRCLPIAMNLPLYGHTLHAERMRTQIAISEPKRKRLWQQIVRAKIEAQAAVLKSATGEDAGLLEMARRVASGDSGNLEGQAARRYWGRLFRPLSFQRTPQNGDCPNNLLDYGYAVLRAITARALVCSGLNVTIGLHHHNRYNSFCLADDVMEPFRPLVDRQVVKLVSERGMEILMDRDTKSTLISPLLGRFTYLGHERTLFDILSALSSNLACVFSGEEDGLLLPDLLLDTPR